MSNIETPTFQRAFLAVSYLTGLRDGALLEALRTPNDEARLFAQRLANPERERRAEVLARELSRVALAVEARGYK